MVTHTCKLLLLSDRIKFAKTAGAKEKISKHHQVSQVQACVFGHQIKNVTQLCKLCVRMEAQNNQPIFNRSSSVTLQMIKAPASSTRDIKCLFRVWREKFLLTYSQRYFGMSICQANVPQDVPLPCFLPQRVHSFSSITVTLHTVMQHSLSGKGLRWRHLHLKNKDFGAKSKRWNQFRKKNIVSKKRRNWMDCSLLGSCVEQFGDKTL